MQQTVTAESKLKPAVTVLLDKCNILGDEAQANLVDQAAETLDAEVRQAVTHWVAHAKEFFPTGKGWSLQHVRQYRHPIRQATEDLAHQLASIYLQVARTARRAAFARAYVVAKAQQQALLAKKPDPVDVLADAGAVKLVREADAITAKRAERQGTQREVARTLVIEPSGLYVLVWPNGTVQLPGGGLEAGETFEDAAVRETLEEAGLTIAVDRWLCDCNDQYAVRKFYVAHVAGLSEAFDPAQHPREPAGNPEGGEFTSVQTTSPHRDIEKIIEAQQYRHYGLRVASKISDHYNEEYIKKRGWQITRDLQLGDIAPSSHEWADGNPSDSLLTGTSAYKVSAGYSHRRANADLLGINAPSGYGGYRGSQVVLLGSNFAEEGNDPGEIVMADAVVLGAWKRSDFEQQKLHEAEHIDPDGDLLVDVQIVDPEAALTLLGSPYDRAAVQTWLNERTRTQE